MRKLPFALLASRVLASTEVGARALLVVLANEYEAEALTHLLVEMAPDTASLFYPAWDCLPYDRASPSAEVMGRRMSVLHTVLKTKGQAIVVTTPEAILQRVPARQAALRDLTLRAGAPVDVGAVETQLLQLGYVHADQVDEPGRFAIRGGVMDVFPPGPNPFRLTLDESMAETIRAYDPLSQRTLEDVEEMRVGPVTELVDCDDIEGFERIAGVEHWLPAFRSDLESLFGYLPEASIMIEPSAEPRVRAVLAQIAEDFKARNVHVVSDDAAQRQALPPDRLYLTLEEWRGLTADKEIAFPEPPQECLPRFALLSKAKASNALKTCLEEARGAGQTIVLSARKPANLQRLSGRAERILGEAPERVKSWSDVVADKPGALLLLDLSAEEGFVDKANLITLITATDLFGSREDAPRQRECTSFQSGDGQLSVGDAVIHFEHGLGILRSLETLESDAVGGRENIRLEYAKGADLLASVDELHQIWHYSAAEDALSLDRLDTDAWQKRRAKIMEDVEESAQALAALAKRRESATAPKLDAPSHDYERFVDGFPFAPTPDQDQAIADVLNDLGAGHPMDRLVVGDVGFGKTEVAMRAAAWAALSGAQVAIVAPTTVLVRQHVENFQKRFGPLGIEIAHLSRLVSDAEARHVKDGLADGSISIAIGTHALLGKAVTFKNLALLIIDEEQRFGTADKAKLREMSEGIHVLTLTATPIPRTLQSALIGLQDLSVIASPPARRRPIRTLVTLFDQTTIKTALTNEKTRGGQSFIVVPRIEDLQPLAETLVKLMPGVDFLVAHGRMPPQETDEVMVRFAEGKGDVLIATSIIESGLDVPRANTMIVVNADCFGLAQLHQLRGRVGRGRQQGICYLMTDADHEIAETSLQRLNTLASLDRLGSGMAISARDLDLRGAGDVVGDEQAGHVRLIGLGLYQHLLGRALRRTRETVSEDWMPEINIDGYAGLLPAEYIPEPEVRLNIYAKLARVEDIQEVEALAEEMEDRFGAFPEAVEALLAMARIKSLCRSQDVARVDAGPKAIAFTFRPDTQPEEMMGQLPKADRSRCKLKDGRMIAAIPTQSPQDSMRCAEHLLEQWS